MYRLSRSLWFITLLLLTDSAFAIEFPQPRYDDNCQIIRDLIEQLPPRGGRIEIPAGTYTCKAPLIIAKSHVVLKGAGKNRTIFRLADWVHAPLLVVGHPHTVQKDGKLVTPWRVEKIKIEGMTFDGNKDNHDVKKECGETHCDGDATSIRNNAISIRGASFVLIQDVSAHSSISGGLVTEKYCDHLKIVRFESYNNYFDGFAGYETEKSLFVDVDLHHNRGAGISIDIRFNDNTFRGGALRDNGDVGVFARDLSGNLFEKMKITGSGNHGVFLASSVEGNKQFCASDNIFRDVEILNSKLIGLRVNDGCEGNRVVGQSVLRGNRDGCVSDDGQTYVEPGVRCEN